MKESTFFHRYKEILLGAFMIVLALFYLYNATLIKTRSTVSVSAKMIPEILGILVIILGICQIVSGVKYLKAVRLKDEAEGNKPVTFASGGMKDATPIILTFVIILLYAILFETLGFIISSILCMFALMWVLSPKSKFNAGKFALISVVVAFVVYIAFRKGLDLSLPGGVLEGVPLL